MVISTQGSNANAGASFEGCGAGSGEVQGRQGIIFTISLAVSTEALCHDWGFWFWVSCLLATLWLNEIWFGQFLLFHCAGPREKAFFCMSVCVYLWVDKKKNCFRSTFDIFFKDNPGTTPDFRSSIISWSKFLVIHWYRYPLFPHDKT